MASATGCSRREGRLITKYWQVLWDSVQRLRANRGITRRTVQYAARAGVAGVRSPMWVCSIATSALKLKLYHVCAHDRDTKLSYQRHTERSYVTDMRTHIDGAK